MPRPCLLATQHRFKKLLRIVRGLQCPFVAPMKSPLSVFEFFLHITNILNRYGAEEGLTKPKYKI